jgi:hypothetical protein
LDIKNITFDEHIETSISEENGNSDIKNIKFE